MKKMPKVDEYDPVIYPRMLWVTGQLEGLKQSFAEHNEQYAYLVGWIAGCISKTIIKLKQYDTRRESDDVEDRA